MKDKREVTMFLRITSYMFNYNAIDSFPFAFVFLACDIRIYTTKHVCQSVKSFGEPFLVEYDVSMLLPFFFTNFSSAMLYYMTWFCLRKKTRKFIKTNARIRFFPDFTNKCKNIHKYDIVVRNLSLALYTVDKKDIMRYTRNIEKKTIFFLKRLSK